MAEKTPLWQKLAQRHSVGAKYLTDPVPSEKDYSEAISAAIAAPNHLRDNQCRMALINDREKLADFFEAGAIQSGATQEEALKARSKAVKAPALLAMIVKIEENNSRVPVYEQWMTAGAFLMQFMDVLENKGFGLKVVSGSSTEYPDVIKALCRKDEKVACWIMIGTSTQVPEGAKRANPADFFSAY